MWPFFNIHKTLTPISSRTFLVVDLCSPDPCRYGTHCRQNDEESYQCVRSLCNPNPCSHGGKCIVVNDESYECACPKGFKGALCEGENRKTKMEFHLRPFSTHAKNLLQVVARCTSLLASLHQSRGGKQKNVELAASFCVCGERPLGAELWKPP